MDGVGTSCCRRVEISGSPLKDVFGRVVLGEEIGEIGVASGPGDSEFVGNAILDPEVAHVDGARAAFFEGLVGDGGSCGVVGGDGSGGLGMAHVGEGLTEDLSFFHVGEEGSDFGFGGSGGDKAEDCVDVEDRAVE